MATKNQSKAINVTMIVYLHSTSPNFAYMRQYTTYKLWATQIIFVLDLFCGGGLIKHVGLFDASLF